jgi:L-threonylcarbamoyladenylate synthase
MIRKKAERIEINDLFNNDDVSHKFQEVEQRISGGEVFVYPTETIYGIGGRADSEDVKNRITTAKTREPENPMILLAGNKDVFKHFGVRFPIIAELLIEYFWPGKLTLVLPYKNKTQTVGVRVSNHPFVIALNQSFAMPVFSTSANLSGRPYANSPDEIYDLFQYKIDFMIDAGTLPPSLPSTVVTIINDNKIEIIREGMVTKEKIVSILEKHFGNTFECSFKS